VTTVQNFGFTSRKHNRAGTCNSANYNIKLRTKLQSPVGDYPFVVDAVLDLVG
jgi:hypothetical protein